MTSQVSILVPIFNVEKYIEYCAVSLFEQTFENIEYVFVNDCTPDKSIEILKNTLEKYPQRKDQIKIIHHSENKGIGTARNTAFQNSSGRYILYIDSDDYIEKDMVELLYNKVERDNADIAVCDFLIQQKEIEKTAIDNVYESKDKNIESIIEAKFSFSSLVNKLISAELFARCKTIPEGMNFGEDRLMMMQLYYYANKIVKVDKALYHYVNNSSSISHNISEKHFEDTVLRWNMVEEFYRKHDIYNKYRDIIGATKVKSKGELMQKTTQCHLLRKYAEIFYEDETKYFSLLTLDKKIILFLVRRKMFFLVQIFNKLLKTYNNLK
ncbi:MAG: glycosyltransferase family 2 protein [Paludibacter sp.]|nr:glycosyltransferase family 2 protein [Paludibacter sp.]